MNHDHSLAGCIHKHKDFSNTKRSMHVSATSPTMSHWFRKSLSSCYARTTYSVHRRLSNRPGSREWRWCLFCTGPTRAAKAGQKSLLPARRAPQTNQGKTPFMCTLWVPICLSFNCQQGPPISSLSGSDEAQKKILARKRLMDKAF